MTLRRVRGKSSVVGIVLLVGVVVVVGTSTVVLGMTLVPDEEPSTSFRTSFEFSRADGDLVVRPNYVSGDARYHLEINGQRVYTWTDYTTRRLSCLNSGDRVTVVAEGVDSRGAYVVEEREVSAPTACSLTGSTARFAYAKVGAKEMPLREENYRFTISMDPDGPTRQPPGDVDRDFPTTNPWVYIQEYDRPIEGLGPPAYVVVYPDNVHWNYDWDSQPPTRIREAMPESYRIDDGDVVVNGSAIEPVNDVYLVFAPGCSESKLEFVRMQGGYNNQILLDGQELFRTDNATTGDTYTVPGVDCTS